MSLSSQTFSECVSSQKMEKDYEKIYKQIAVISKKIKKGFYQASLNLYNQDYRKYKEFLTSPRITASRYAEEDKAISKMESDRKLWWMTYAKLEYAIASLIANKWYVLLKMLNPGEFHPELICYGEEKDLWEDSFRRCEEAYRRCHDEKSLEDILFLKREIEENKRKVEELKLLLTNKDKWRLNAATFSRRSSSSGTPEASDSSIKIVKKLSANLSSLTEENLKLKKALDEETKNVSELNASHSKLNSELKIKIESSQKLTEENKNLKEELNKETKRSQLNEEKIALLEKEKKNLEEEFKADHKRKRMSEEENNSLIKKLKLENANLQNKVTSLHNEFIFIRRIDSPPPPVETTIQEWPRLEGLF